MKENIIEKNNQEDLIQEIYSGNSERIKLKLGSQDFLIIKSKVKNLEDKSDSYYIIDPKKYDNNTLESMKQIKEGEEIILGRESETSSIFDFDNTVSRKHAKISLNQGEISIQDLNSKNGTNVETSESQLEESDDYSVNVEKNEEPLENIEINKTEKEIFNFIEFVKNNSLEIESQIDNKIDEYKLEYPNLSPDQIRDAFRKKYIYSMFYSKNDPEKVNYSSEDTVKFEQYNQALENMLNLIESNKDKDILIENQGGWNHALVNADKNFFKDDSNKIGRLYLNINPEIMPGLFHQLVTEGINNQLKFYIKLPNKANEENFNRADKIIMYFRPEESQKILDLVSKIYNQREVVFQDQLPKFVQPIKISENKMMKGVGFGQEPHQRNNRKFSFGEIRSTVLVYLYKDILNNNIDKDKLLNKFKKGCEKFSIDPDNPAFNNQDNSFNIFKND